MKVETVVIDTKNGPVEINKSDFDAAVHTPYGVKARPHGRKKTSAK